MQWHGTARFVEVEAMAYKGGDLDLRSAGPALPREAPETKARGFDIAWRRPEAGGAHPIAVDDLVLACCNRAYDVALFHGSGDVRLAHLLHALTRVGPAAQVLGDIGIRADILRRETAVAIAAELPAGTTAGEGAPRASAALEDALRRAAEHAEQRRQPVCVHDLIRALLGGGPESPAATLLMRAAVDPQRLERWRDEPRREALVATLPAGPVQAQARDVPPPVSAALIDRFDRMEASLRSLAEEVAADRRATAELLRAVHAELQEFRAEGARAPAADRSEAIDAVLEAKLGEFGSAMAALAGRMGAIDKLAGGDNWQALGARLEAVEGRVAGQAAELADTLSGMLSGRFDQAEARLQPLEEGIERQTELEASIRAELQAAEEASKARDQQLAEIHETMATLGAGLQLVAENLATWRIESGGDIGIVSNRLQQLEETAIDRIDQVHGEVQALRHEQQQGEARHGNGFKRWLYGTGSVFATSWRDEAASIRQTLERPREGGKS